MENLKDMVARAIELRRAMNEPRAALEYGLELGEPVIVLVVRHP